MEAEARETESVVAEEESPWVCLKCLPCFGVYAGDVSDQRTVISNAPFGDGTGDLAEHEFVDNYVSTTRYTWWNFIFKNLYEQFQKAANFYFLVMAVITSIPGVSTIPVWATVTPLGFVLAVTAIKDGVDDYKRYKNDRELNHREVEVLTLEGGHRPTKWQNVQVGHIVRVQQDEVFPADLVILSSSVPNGECSIQTATLDGETNLKPRQAVKETVSMSPEQLAKIGGLQCVCERPNTTLYKFNGNLILQNREEKGPGTGGRFSLNPSHMLLRGALLKETAWVYGLVVYTGNQTKIMLNNDPPRFKRSHVDQVMNKQLFIIFGLQFCIVFTATVLSGWFYTNVAPDHWYLSVNDSSNSAGASVALRDFFAFYVLLSVMVPISLYVSMELVRVGQAILVNVDGRMYDPEDGKFGTAKSSTLSEELGQIQYIFSDKTGTLTSNQMAFQKCSINGKLYGDTPTGGKNGEDEKDPDAVSNNKNSDEKRPNDTSDPTDKLLLQQPPSNNSDSEQTLPAGAVADLATVEIDGDPKFCNMRDPVLLSALLNGDRKARDYVLALALCHTVSVRRDPEREGKVLYNGESTDEVALVTMASFHGVRFISRRRKEVTIVVPWMHDGKRISPLEGVTRKPGARRNTIGTYVTFEILHVIAFSSDRKRMSVIVKFPDGSIRVITKGADNVMKKLALTDSKDNPPQLLKSIDEHLFQFSREGLRVMLVGQRELTAGEYKEWATRYQAASESFGQKGQNRGDAMATIAAEVEQKLKILGVTAIEDKLQVGVPRTLKLLKAAGIKIWVLTGDKQNTAVNIGKSCGLIGWGYQLCYIRQTKAKGCEGEMKAILESLHGGSASAAALMVTGDSLKAAICKRNRDTLFAVMSHPKVRVVVASRMSPRQKAEIVSLVKEKLDVVTLAIGDGANDVSMIRAAHVGVGIRGREGMQAANASDFAVSKFMFLTQLLLVHGTLSYYRNSTLILYFFYKNVMIAVQQVFFLFHAGYSSEEVFDGYMLNTFNLCWTALPILLFSVFDRVANVDELLEFPQLYLPGLRGDLFNYRTFWISFFEAVFHGSIVWLVTWFTIHDIFDSYWACSVATYSVVVLVANTKMAMITNSWFWFNALIIILTVLVYFGFIYLYCGQIGFSFSPWLFGVIQQVMAQPMFYLAAFFLCMGVFLQDFVWAYIKRLTRPDLLMLVQESRVDPILKQELSSALRERHAHKGSTWNEMETGTARVEEKEIPTSNGVNS
mmetsp:Transcript_31469/g.76780  ORF Transcript_31469/g.76780 Transcript_31469/m.76780 type:complete len:1236 (-) Transcript_31469:171-3878(-)